MKAYKTTVSAIFISASSVLAGWGLIVLAAVVIAAAVATAVAIKRLSDIPPIDRERQIRVEMFGDREQIWAWYTNYGTPPSFQYVNGLDEWPMDVWHTRPLTNDGVVYNWFELVSVAPPAPHSILVCSRWDQGFSELAVVGGSENPNGFTNRDFEVWRNGGQWEVQPTAYARTNYKQLFWTAIAK